MKLLVALLVAICVAAVIADDEEKEWEDFKIKFSKLFLSKGKEEKRRNAFKKHKAQIDELQTRHKAGDIKYAPAMYAFHDLEPEEIMARMTGLKVPEVQGDIKEEAVVETRAAPPSAYDSRSKFKFNAPRNQGSCGSCWTFSSINAIEVSYARKYNQQLDLSEQQLVNCVYAANNESGCDGGWMDEAFAYLTKIGGVSEESVVPYTGVNGKCVQKTKKVTLADNSKINKDETAIKNAIMDYGSLAVCVDAKKWNYYGTGIFTVKKPGTINHAVNLVGWGTENGTDYWTIRNSWGDDWGENGYIRVARTKYGTMDPNYVFAVNVN